MDMEKEILERLAALQTSSFAFIQFE